VFENRVQRRIFGLKRDEVTEGWRRLSDEEFRHLYCSPNIIRIIKSRRMRWVGHVERLGRRGRTRTYRCGIPRRKETTTKTKT
jgi:hypothetical protein